MKNRFAQWQDNNYRKYWKWVLLALFILMVTVFVLLAGIGLYWYFTFPTIPISVTQPANVWGLLLFGGGIREYWFGVSSCLLWFWFRQEWRKSKSVTKYTQTGELKMENDKT